MEVGGLEPLQDSPCLSNIAENAARYPARFDEQTGELLALWGDLDEAARDDLLHVARQITWSDSHVNRAADPSDVPEDRFVITENAQEVAQTRSPPGLSCWRRST